MTLPTGSSFIDVTLEQTARKMPIDETLMQAIDEDLYYLYNKINQSPGGVLEWKVNGSLAALVPFLPYRRIDAAFVSRAMTLSSWGMYLELAGLSGTLECDVRKYRVPNSGITAIDYQYQANINSISRAGLQGLTQTITKATPQISTQSVTFWKPALNVNSIIGLGNNVWRYNLVSAPDVDWKAGDFITIASCTNAANNGTFQILRVNQDSGFNIDVVNNSGAAQTSPAGTCTLQALSYNFTNPASLSFVVGESVLLAGHTSANNNGTFLIYAVNQGGNNIIIKNQLGVAQGAAAGTADCYRWIYTLSAAVSSDIVVGEMALFASHTNSNNNGNFQVKNVSSTQITVYNLLGVLQGSADGTVDSNRWVYALSSDPSSSFLVGQTFNATATASSLNSGLQTVVQINRSATNNLVVYNLSGVVQGGAAGIATHTYRILKFATDQSMFYAANSSRVVILGTPDSNYLGKELIVVEVNRGGGSNYNIVINDATALSAPQASPAGRVFLESRSVFSVRPLITSTDDMQIATNAVLDPVEKVVAANTILAMEILQIPVGRPQNLAVHVS